MKDAEFLSGRFFWYQVPKEKRYLLKYFYTPLQQAFLRYYLIFGQVKNFRDHTGWCCDERFIFRMQSHLKRLIKTYDDAKASLTEEGMEIVSRMEDGKLPLTKLPKC